GPHRLSGRTRPQRTDPAMDPLRRRLRLLRLSLAPPPPPQTSQVLKSCRRCAAPSPARSVAPRSSVMLLSLPLPPSLLLCSLATVTVIASSVISLAQLTSDVNKFESFTRSRVSVRCSRVGQWRVRPLNP